MSSTVRYVCFFTTAIAFQARYRARPLTSNNTTACSPGSPIVDTPACDTSLGWRARAQSLVQLMSIDEKISWLGNTSPAIERLGVPAYQWWSEALHGVADSPGVTFGGELTCATSFPEPILFASAFDRTLVNLIATVVSTEARAFNNAGQAGLSFFTPNINIFRDPRWGRGQETPGEDPYLTSQYVYALIRGLQEGEDARYVKVIADCKHFAAYDLEDWNGVDRFHFDANVTQQDLVETYMPPFETCVRDAHVQSVMCSYNSVNGVPSCANADFLSGLLRDDWQMDGWVTSDCGAIAGIYETHHYASSPEQAVQFGLQAGCDQNCGSYYQNYTKSALSQGLVNEGDIDGALIRTIGSLVRAGWLDDPSVVPQVYRSYGPQDVNTTAAHALAYTAAVEGMVLLKNGGSSIPSSRSAPDGAALPWTFGESLKTLALIGPMSNASDTMQGNYAGQACGIVTPLRAFQQFAKEAGFNVLYASGCDVNGTSQDGFAEAIQAASSADAIIFIGGIDQDIESEGHDRVVIELPAIQMQLVQQLVDAVPDKPFLFAYMSGGQVDLSAFKDAASPQSIMWLGYPGQAGGSALVDIVRGVVSPAGRLPVTQYPAEYVNAVSMFDMSFRPSATNPGRTYRFYPPEKAVFEFGTGLSYTTFEYVWLDSRGQRFPLVEVKPSSHAHAHAHSHAHHASLMLSHSSTVTFQQVRISSLVASHRKSLQSPAVEYICNVTNTGSRSSDVVVLAFLIPPATATADAPLKQLIGFERISSLPVGCTVQIQFGFLPSQFAVVDAEGHKWLKPGDYVIGVDVPTQHKHRLRLTGKAMRLE